MTIVADVMNIAAAVQRTYGVHPLSWWKLHKLLYFCQGWGLAWTGEPLFEQPIQAWRDGPVVREVYRIQKYYSAKLPPENMAALRDVETAIVRAVVEFYGVYTTSQLVELTHREPPWRTARAGIPNGVSCRNEITHESLHAYFKGLGATSTRSLHIPSGVRRTVDILLLVPPDAVAEVSSGAGRRSDN